MHNSAMYSSHTKHPATMNDMQAHHSRPHPLHAALPPGMPTSVAPPPNGPSIPSTDLDVTSPINSHAAPNSSAEPRSFRSPSAVVRSPTGPELLRASQVAPNTPSDPRLVTTMSAASKSLIEPGSVRSPSALTRSPSAAVRSPTGPQLLMTSQAAPNSPMIPRLATVLAAASSSPAPPQPARASLAPTSPTAVQPLTSPSGPHSVSAYPKLVVNPLFLPSHPTGPSSAATPSGLHSPATHPRPPVSPLAAPQSSTHQKQAATSPSAMHVSPTGQALATSQSAASDSAMDISPDVTPCAAPDSQSAPAGVLMVPNSYAGSKQTTHPVTNRLTESRRATDAAAAVSQRLPDDRQAALPDAACLRSPHSSIGASQASYQTDTSSCSFTLTPTAPARPVPMQPPIVSPRRYSGPPQPSTSDVDIINLISPPQHQRHASTADSSQAQLAPNAQMPAADCRQHHMTNTEQLAAVTAAHTSTRGSSKARLATSPCSPGQAASRSPGPVQINVHVSFCWGGASAVQGELDLMVYSWDTHKPGHKWQHSGACICHPRPKLLSHYIST